MVKGKIADINLFRVKADYSESNLMSVVIYYVMLKW